MLWNFFLVLSDASAETMTSQAFPVFTAFSVENSPLTIVLDVTGRKNGRGAYLCFSKECLQKAIKNKGLERSLKMQIPQEVYENLERELDTIEL